MKEESSSKIALMLSSRDTGNIYETAVKHNAHVPKSLVNALHPSEAPSQNNWIFAGDTQKIF